MLNPALKPSRSARIGLSFRLVPPVLAAAAAFALYLATMPPSITWQSGGQDSGNLAVAVQGLGIPHPTGYPTYVLLGKLFSYLPFGDLAYRLNVMSAVFAAGTVFFTYLLIVGLGRIKGGYMPVESPNPPSPPLVTYRPPLAPLIRGEPSISFSNGTAHHAIARSKEYKIWQSTGAATGALLLAASPLFWSQAITTEVQALNAFFFTLVLWLLLRWRRSLAGGHAYLYLAGLLFGVGLGNHVTLLALLPAGLAIVFPRLRELRFSLKHIIPALLLCLGGLGVYLLLPLRAAAAPYANWGDPRSLERFVWLVSGGEYRYLLHSLSLPQIGSRLAGIVSLLLGGFGPWGLALGLLGFVNGVRRARLLTLGLVSTFALLAVYAANYAAENSSVYLIPAFIIWALWVGQGTALLLQFISAKGRAKTLAVVASALLLLSPLVLGAWDYQRQDLHADRSALDYALGSLSVAPAHALLLTNRDEQTFSLEYAQQVLGVRQDVAVIDSRLMRWDWYRKQKSRSLPQLRLATPTTPDASDPSGLLAANLGSRPCLTAFYDPALLTAYQLVPLGKLFEVRPH